MTTAAQLKRPLSVDEAASLLRVGRDTLLRFRNKGLHATRRDGTWQISRSHLAEFINVNTITPEGQAPDLVTDVDIPRARTLEEAAEESGLPLSFLKNACRRGRVPHIRAGKGPRMTPAQIIRAQELFSVEARQDDELQADRLAYASGRRGPRRQAA